MAQFDEATLGRKVALCLSAAFLQKFVEPGRDQV